LKDESIERVLKSFIDEKSLLKLLRIFDEENKEKESQETNKKFKKIPDKDILNTFYN
jgi:hypothetical protein